MLEEGGIKLAAVVTDLFGLTGWSMLELTAELGRAMNDHARTVELLCKMPGIDQCAAQALLAEIGPKAAAFKTPEQLASWIGVCPGSQESAGVSYSTRSAKGNRYLRRILCSDSLGCGPQ